MSPRLKSPAFRLLCLVTALSFLTGCGYKKRAEAVRAAEAELIERGEAVSSWADELEAVEEDVAAREARLAKERAKLEKEREGVMKMRRELEAWHKDAMVKSLPSVTAKYAVVIDVGSGTTLFEKDADRKTAVASTQKLMTALLVAEKGNLEGIVTVVESDTRVEPTKLYIKPGEKYLRGDLLEALLVKSGNDVALCLARDHSGSKERFSERMNAKAKQLGMMDSHFKNPHGLTERGQYSTARDMATLAKAVYENPVLRRIVKTPKTTFEMADGKSKILVNTNRVLREYAPCDGMKTGYTSASGHCLVSSGSREGKGRIVVVLGSSGRSIWTDSRKLLEWSLKIGEGMRQQVASQ